MACLLALLRAAANSSPSELVPFCASERTSELAFVCSTLVLRANLRRTNVEQTNKVHLLLFLLLLYDHHQHLAVIQLFTTNTDSRQLACHNAPSFVLADDQHTNTLPNQVVAWNDASAARPRTHHRVAEGGRKGLVCASSLANLRRRRRRTAWPVRSACENKFLRAKAGVLLNVGGQVARRSGD